MTRCVHSAAMGVAGGADFHFCQIPLTPAGSLSHQDDDDDDDFDEEEEDEKPKKKAKK